MWALFSYFQENLRNSLKLFWKFLHIIIHYIVSNHTPHVLFEFTVKVYTRFVQYIDETSTYGAFSIFTTYSIFLIDSIVIVTTRYTRITIHVLYIFMWCIKRKRNVRILCDLRTVLVNVCDINDILTSIFFTSVFVTLHWWWRQAARMNNCT